MKEIVKLYKLMKREKKLHREILVFIILHDYRSTRIYNHYVLINEDKIIFYRHFCESKSE